MVELRIYNFPNRIDGQVRFTVPRAAPRVLQGSHDPQVSALALAPDTHAPAFTCPLILLHLLVLNLSGLDISISLALNARWWCFWHNLPSTYFDTTLPLLMTPYWASL